MFRKYEDWIARLRSHDHAATIQPYGEVVEGDVVHELLRVTTPGRVRLVITAGFHGNEKAGPLTLAEHLGEIVDHARAHDVGLTIYPCINPSGFTANTRYNQSGEAPNNDFLRYEIAPGEWLDVLPAGQPYLRHDIYRGGPKETRALRRDLEQHPPPVAALDIHQDPYLHQPLVYAYCFGEQEPFAALIEASAAFAPVARSFPVDTGVMTDPDGLIRLHDGSITDWFHRSGVPFTAALETTTATPIEDCHQVNLTWIRGFIALAAGSGS